MTVNKDRGKTLILHSSALTPTLSRRSGSKAKHAPVEMDEHPRGES